MTLVLTLFAIAVVLSVLGGGGNLTGLVVIIVAAYGLLMGLAVAAFGSLLRVKGLPRWAPLVLLVAVAAFSLAANTWLWWSHYDHSRRIVGRVDEIRRAELAYAAAQEVTRLPATGQTCRA